MSESRVWENHMHGLTGGSWKRNRRLPRQLPTLLSMSAIVRETLDEIMQSGPNRTQLIVPLRGYTPYYPYC
jgi:hypothetical protein